MFIIYPQNKHRKHESFTKFKTFRSIGRSRHPPSPHDFEHFYLDDDADWSLVVMYSATRSS